MRNYAMIIANKVDEAILKVLHDGYKPEMLFVSSETKVDFLTPSKPKYIHEELRCEI